MPADALQGEPLSVAVAAVATPAGAGVGPASDHPSESPSTGHGNAVPIDDVTADDSGWPLWVTHLVLPLGMAALFLTTALLQRAVGWIGVAGAVLLVGLVAWQVASRIPARGAGVLAWGGACGLLGMLTACAALGAIGQLRGVLAGFGSVAVGGLVLAWRWEPEHGSDLTRLGRVARLGDGAFRPPKSWAAWIVGGGLAAPLASLYAPIILDVDSAWVVMATQGAHDQGIRFLQDTQDVLLPQIVSGPTLRIWGYQGAIALSIAMVGGLVALVSAFAYHLTRRPIASFVAAGTLLAMPSVVPGAYRLPMYATMLLLGYAGALLVHGAMGGPWPRRWWWAVIGGVLLALAPEAHSLGQLFLVVPFLLLILHPPRRAVRPLVVSVAAMVVTSLPRLWLNLSVGGLHRFRSNRTDWLVEKGYLRMINERLRNQRSNDGPLAYLGNIPHLLVDAFGIVLLVVVVGLVAAAARATDRRTLVFGVAVVAAFVVALVVAAPGTYGRYLTPLGVGAAVVAGCGASELASRLPNRSGDGARVSWRAVAMAAAVVVVALAVVETGTNVHDHQADVRRLGPALTELADEIPPGEGVIGVRSNLMVYVDPNLRTIYGRTMSERDFVTYMTWPSDAAVIRMMRRLGVTWVVVRDSKFGETLYHETWLRPVYGERDRHADRIHESDRFCREAHINRTVLYKIGSCKGIT